jgi:hypothetical protein
VFVDLEEDLVMLEEQLLGPVLGGHDEAMPHTL